MRWTEGQELIREGNEDIEEGSERVKEGEEKILRGKELVKDVARVRSPNLSVSGS